MAGPELLTKDDIPLYEIGDFTLELMDVFNEEASRGFIDRFSQEVNSRTFLARTGDMTWEEVAELEHARTGSIDDYQMAFNVATYAKDLGFSREYIEDSPGDLIQDHVSELIAGGRDKMFDVVFSVLKDGIADGSTLWYDPEDYGAHSFTNTHNHTYTGLTNSATDASKVLFSDTNAHTPSQIIRELSHELTHHGYTPDVALVNEKFADRFIEELTDGFGSQYYAPQAEQLQSSAIPDNAVQTNNVTIMKTAWLTEPANDDYQIYMYDSSGSPVKRHTVRPMEITDNSGAPVGGAGGFRGDPGALLGTYGSMRFGSKFGDPLAGVTINEIKDSEIATS